MGLFLETFAFRKTLFVTAAIVAVITAREAHASVYGLKNTYSTSIVQTTSLASSSWRDVFRQKVDLKKGDLLIVSASQQFSEKQLRSNRVLMFLSAGPTSISSTVWQNLQRGTGNNHHMPLGVHGQYVAQRDQVLTIALRAKKLSSSTVILDKPNFGSLTIEHYRRYATKTHAVEDRAMLLSQFKSHQSKSRMSLIGKNNGFARYKRHALNFSKIHKGDKLQLSSQLMARHNSLGKSAEMFVNEIKTSQRHLIRAGENVTHDLNHIAVNHSPIFDLKSGSISIDNNAYAGNGSGVYLHDRYGFLQGLLFSRGGQKGNQALERADVKKQAKTFFHPLNKAIEGMRSASHYFDTHGGIIRARASAQFHNLSTKVGTCYMRIHLYQWRSGRMIHIRSSPYVFRQTSRRLHQAVHLKKTFSFKVSKGRYQTRQVTLCRGAAGLKIRTYAGRGFLGTDFFN